jgi:hypothetical protein
MSPEALVTIARLHDPVRAEMLRELLSRQGIPAAAPGAFHRGLLGPLGAYIVIPLQVPARHEARARALLADVQAPEKGWEVIDENGRQPAGRTLGWEPEGDAEERGPRPRIKRIAAFCAVGMTFGCGHFYARAMVAGGLLLAAELGVLLLGVPGGTWLTFLALPFLIGVDLVGSALAVDRHNAGQPLSGADQLRRTAPLAMFAVVWAAITASGWGPLEDDRPVPAMVAPAALR